MNQNTHGWVLFVAALGAVLGLVGHELSQVPSWTEASTTAFVGKAMGHVATVIASFVAGRLLPQVGK